VCWQCLKRAWSVELFFSQYYIGSLWGQTCCSVMDGKLQLKHLSAANKRRSAKSIEQGKDDSIEQFSIQPHPTSGCILNCSILSSLPCFYAFGWFAIPTSRYIFNVFFILVLTSNSSKTSSLVSRWKYRQVTSTQFPVLGNYLVVEDCCSKTDAPGIFIVCI